MQSHRRRLLLNSIPIFLTVAVLGYLAGGMAASGSSSSTRSRADTVSAAEATVAVSSPVVLAYPAAPGWRVASGAPTIPGLSIATPLLLEPAAGGGRVGLIAGRLAEAGPAPLPARLLARLSRLPAGEVVDLTNTQAYRYRLTIPGFARQLTIYAIPSSAATAAIACYAPASGALAGDLRVCEQIVAKLALQVEAQSYELLTPDAGYAHQLSAAIAHVNELRLALRPAMRPGVASATLSGLATRLAAGLAGTAETLSTLQPPAAAGSAHTTLSTALWRTRDAYAALAAAANANSAARYAAARGLVVQAEANLASALRSFKLLGYA
jgi:hypothetical protein